MILSVTNLPVWLSIILAGAVTTFYTCLVCMLVIIVITYTHTKLFAKNTNNQQLSYVKF